MAVGFGIFAAAVIISYFSAAEVEHPKSNDVYLVIDSSGSMQDENKIEYAKNAAYVFVDTLLQNNQTGYRVGLITFSGHVTVISKITTDANHLKDGISEIRLGDYTAVGDAIGTATQSLSQEGRSDEGKTILLLTDGMSNTGSDPISQARVAAQNDITIYSVGYGSDADSTTLSMISSITGGQYYSASSGSQLISSFGKIANLIISPVAHYGSRTLILIAIPILLFIPAIEKGMVTMVEKFEATMIKKKKTQVFCPKCGQSNPVTVKFCAKCGNRFKDRARS